MKPLDAIARDPPQDPSCDMLTQRARDLENAEFREGVPALQHDDFWVCRHPTLSTYRDAKYLAENRKPIPDINIAEAQAIERAAVKEYLWRCDHARGGGLRRIVDAFVRHQRTQRDLAAIRKRDSHGYVARNGGKRRVVVNGYVSTGRTILIDGVRVPVIEKV